MPNSPNWGRLRPLAADCIVIFINFTDQLADLSLMYCIGTGGSQTRLRGPGKFWAEDLVLRLEIEKLIEFARVFAEIWAFFSPQFWNYVVTSSSSMIVRTSRTSAKWTQLGKPSHYYMHRIIWSCTCGKNIKEQVDVYVRNAWEMGRLTETSTWASIFRSIVLYFGSFFRSRCIGIVLRCLRVHFPSVIKLH